MGKTKKRKRYPPPSPLFNTKDSTQKREKFTRPNPLSPSFSSPLFFDSLNVQKAYKPQEVRFLFPNSAS